MPWFAKPSDVWLSDFSAIGLNLRVPIFTGFGTRAKVRQVVKYFIERNKRAVALDLDFKSTDSD
jgi:hypothetical protein